MKPDVLTVIESAYRLDSAPADWLRGIADAVYSQIGSPIGLLGFEYRVTPEDRLEVGRTVEIDTPREAAALTCAELQRLPPEYIRRTFVRSKCDTLTQGSTAEMRETTRPIMEAVASFGARDVFIVSAMDPSGHGVYLGAWLPNARRLPARARQTWSRMAVHLVAGQRLRRQIGPDEAGRADTADAVLTPSGELAQARGEATGRDARVALREAVRGIERARTSQGRRDPERAVDLWKGLVSARWTLVDCFESDGKRYVLARRNDVVLDGIEALTPREHQALAWAALGHTNKVIAYEMGISSSTVGVLLHRAAAKLGAASRAELIAKFHATRI